MATARQRTAAALVMHACFLSACEEHANPARADAKLTQASVTTIPSKVIDDVATGVAADANSVPAAITSSLAWDVPTSTYALDGLQIQLPGQAGPSALGWWLWRQGDVQLLGANSLGQPVVAFTPKGLAMAGAAGPWVAASVTGTPSNIDCEAGASVTAMTCSFDLQLKLTLTPVGRSALGRIQIADVAVRATATSGSGGWQLGSVTPNGPSAQDQAEAAIFGPPDQWSAAHDAALQEINQRLAAGVAPQPTPTPTPTNDGQTEGDQQ